MLVAQAVTKTYAGRHGDVAALAGVNLVVARGESVAIVGPSGAGKSTLLHVLGTLDRPTSGAVLYDDVDPYTLAPTALAAFRNQHIGFVFQNHHLLPEFSALENTMMPALIGGMTHAEADAKARAMLEVVGLGHRLTHAPAELSGGENQRVAVARAALLHPRLILADEPTGNLDTETGRTVEDLLLALNAEHGITLVIVTHNRALADRMHHVVELHDGSIRETVT